MAVKLWKNDRAYQVALRDVRAAFDRRRAERQALRRTRQDFVTLEARPQGAFRQLDDYYSIQNHFPYTYGINAYGVPDSAPPRRKAQAKQLKAYLLFFEQIMANFLANTQGIRTLFSRDRDLQYSYFYQVLRQRNVPNVQDLYTGGVDAVDAELRHIVGKYDPFSDRRNRILEYLLGIYGEKFTQNSLQHFNYYATAQELPYKLIANKLRLLDHLVELSQKRAAALNYRETSWNSENISMLQKKVSILLGLPYVHTRSLTDVFIENGLEVMTDDQFARVQEGIAEMAFVDLGDIDERLQQPFQPVPPEAPPAEDDRRLLQEIIFLRHNVVSGSILRNGIELDRYRVGSVGDGQTFQLAFRPDTPSRWLYLASYDTAAEAVRAAHDLRRFLIRLNVESEGVHLVEHLLLRPARREASDSRIPADFYAVGFKLRPADFHALRLSVILPSWTARFNDREFRKLAEETVQLNCPAHIDPECSWLDFDAMRTFENLYRTWLDAKCDRGASVDTINAAAQQLLAFLLANRAEGPVA